MAEKSKKSGNKFGKNDMPSFRDCKPMVEVNQTALDYYQGQFQRLVKFGEICVSDSSVTQYPKKTAKKK
jgi:hypothetical protein